jgi:tetracycline 7-halogenase / FADH2 O2-dependent halogenase
MNPMTESSAAPTYDLAIIGSGFGGSLLAQVARRIGLSVALLERWRHPRFAIGESTSPLTNLLIEEIAKRYNLPRLLPLTTFGSWQKSYPQIACGLKRGFTFYGHRAGHEFRDTEGRECQLLVAASPCDEVSDMHWFRADVDEFLMREAVDCGADYIDGIKLEPPIWSADGALLTGVRDGQIRSLRARLVVDATGPRGYIARSLGITEEPLRGFENTQGLFTHFTGVRRCDSMPEFDSNETAPFPIDDAALHHVFEGGWMWVLRFGNGITSAGFAVTNELATDLGLPDRETAWPRFLERFPSIGRQFENAIPTRPFVYSPSLPYRAQAASGPGWVMLPSATAFIDPLFSTGIPLTLLGIERLGRILSESWSSSDLQPRLDDYAAVTLEEADTTSAYIGACRRAMSNFGSFSAMSMFYFAAASYSEMARRLVSPLRPSRYLAADHPGFRTALRKFSNSTATVENCLHLDRQIAAIVECINVAGLCDRAKRNWYDVDLADVVDAAHKLGFDSERVRKVLRNADWAQPNSL